LKKRELILGSVVFLALVALVVWGRDRIHFDFGVFFSQLKLADWRKIGIAFGCIYICYAFRAARWALLLRHIKKVPLFSLLGTQIIGFTAVALIGRIADPVRPYLVSKKIGLPLSNQIAVYIVERLFDAGSMALIFSIAMISVPTSEIMHALHPHAAAQPGAHSLLSSFLVRFGGLTMTLLGAAFLFLVKVSGNLVADFFERAFGLFSSTLGHAVGNRIRSFRTGLDALRSPADLTAVSLLSLAMWFLIAMAYFECCRAFVAAPGLANITPSKSVLLMIASGGASIIQLPVIGWFSQIGIVAVALDAVLGVAAEPATACAATLLLVTFLGIVPVGLVWARFEHVSLRKVAAESGHAKEVLIAEEPAG
jgi:hypothetical protein